MLNARLITFALNFNDTTLYTTNDYSVEFYFINKNCEFIDSNATYFLVRNEVKSFVLNFIDDEGDNVVFNVSQNNIISFYIQSTNTTSEYKIFLLANELINGSTNLIVKYSDSYHQDESFIQTIIFELYIFEVEPPYFITDPPIISASRCHNSSFTLPNIIDPSNLLWNISLDASTPQWITLI